ncbi:MAG: LCP family protein [Tepidibacillus sp.]
MKQLFKWRKKTKWIVGILSLIIIGFSSVLGYYVYQLNQTMDQIYEPVERVSTNIAKEKEKSSTTKTYLILGVDQRPGDKGRTDGIILAIVNDHTKQITLTSIPRDTYVEIAGKDYKDKINHAYQYGIGTTIATVENFTGIPVDHYVMFNLDGFVKAIDAIGGIRVKVDGSIAKNAQLPGEGEHLLTGEQALFFSRFRYDSKGDYGRNDRQQEVLKAFLDQSKEVRSPKKINDLLEILGQDVRTDITKSEMYSLAKQLNNYSSQQVEQIKYKSTGKRFGPQNLWYGIITEEERERVSNELKKRLSE